MTPSGELRDTILRVSQRLFVEQGYKATSIKQIAQAAGCVTSALYYYFEKGKSQILGEVIRTSMGDPLQLLQDLQEVTSLAELLQHFGTMVINSFPEIVTNNSWLQLEYPRLSEAEKQQVRLVFLGLHRSLTQQIARFVSSEEQAAKLAWVLVFIYNGYEQLIIRLELGQDANGQFENFPEFVTKMLVNTTQQNNG